MLKPGGISAWHTHQKTVDRLFANHGLVKVVLYDARKNSPTFGRLNIFRIGTVRPALIIVPPGVWHGVQNISGEPAMLLISPIMPIITQTPTIGGFRWTRTRFRIGSMARWRGDFT